MHQCFTGSRDPTPQRTFLTCRLWVGFLREGQLVRNAEEPDSRAAGASLFAVLQLPAEELLCSHAVLQVYETGMNQ